MSAQRKHDLVLFGATGFVGQLTAEYLAGKQELGSLSWALAGRNRDKLEAVRARLKERFPDSTQPDLIEVDVSDDARLMALAENARVVITTVGPYILYGEGLVRACALVGTHYVDLTGEPEFADQMWLRYHEAACASGARLVHCCGFDSIPHDLGAYFSVKQLPDGQPIKLEGFVRAGGQFSGGTYHSAVNAFARLRHYSSVRKERQARESRSSTRKIGSMPARIRYDSRLGTWVVPFPSIDQQVVKRSATALEAYGPDFRYGHFIQVKRLHNVAALLGGAGGLLVGSQFKPTRDLLLKIKQPGDGPDEQTRAKSWFKVTFLGEAGGQKVRTQVSGGDPGYSETAKMLGESALCLILDELPPDVAGQLTPAVAMGDALLARLQAAGIRFEVLAPE